MDSIYRRTSLGQEKVMQRATDIPPRLKTLLMLIDGKTQKSKLVQFLPNFGDVEALLEALELSGYITSMPNFLETVSITPEAVAAWSEAETAISASANARFGHESVAPHFQPPAPALALREEPQRQVKPSEPSARVPAHDEQLQRFATQQPAMRRASNTGNFKLAVQLLCDNLSEVGTLDAIDLMVRVERCQSSQEVEKYLRAFHQLCTQAMGPKLADDKLRALQRMLG